MKKILFLLLGCLYGGAIGFPQAATAQVTLETSLANPTMRAGSDGKQTNYLKIGLQASNIPSSGKRAPVNLALVIDKSGSMTGEKIAAAKNAALEAVERLKDDDIVSIIAYDSTVTVLLPATKSSDRRSIRRAIQGIEAGGSTALFAGVSKGAAEVRKFKTDHRVNRVILLSDGLANVGPSSPDALQELGTSLLEEGITVSTLGLGLDYNEDLMAKLAASASGNHVFIESVEDVGSVFQNEFDEVLSVVAKDFDIRVKLNEGIRPVKLLSTHGDIEGQRVSIRLGQLYANQQRFYLLEVEVPPGEHGSQLPLGSVHVSYMNLRSESKEELSSRVSVRFDRSADRIAADENPDVVSKCAILVCNERNRLATELRDRGNTEAAKELLEQNTSELKGLLNRYEGKDGYAVVAPQVVPGIKANEEQSAAVLKPDWNRNRKAMREVQNAYDQQQRYGGKGSFGGDKAASGQKVDLFGGPNPKP